MITKMTVVSFLRKKGYSVVFTDNKNIILVDGEKSYISCKIKTIQRDLYVFAKPLRKRANENYTYCFAAFVDKDGIPVYRIAITDAEIQRPSVSSHILCKYPITFIGNLQPSFKGTYPAIGTKREIGKHDHSYVKRDNLGKFISTKPYSIFESHKVKRA